MAERQPTLVTPFWVRIATETNLSPGWLLVGIPAVLYPTYLLLEVLFGRGLAAATVFGGDFEARLLPMMAATLGYAVMMYTYVARGTFRDLADLGPVLRGGEATKMGVREQLVQFGRRRLWIGAVIGVSVTVVLDEVMAGRLTRLLAGEWSLRDPCLAMILIAFSIVIGWGAVYLIDSARVYSRIGEQHVEVDLLDLSPLLPLTRHGLRIVLLLVISTAALAPFFAIGASPESNPMIVPFVIFFWNLVLAAAVFFLPLRGLRRHIRARKAEELAKVREDIRIDHELVAQRGAESSEAGGRLPGLLAYKHEIESVQEWPFDAPTLARFFLYVAIPLGSWVGGALVERLLGAALD